jgi:hypothetical protein
MSNPLPKAAHCRLGQKHRHHTGIDAAEEK